MLFTYANYISEEFFKQALWYADMYMYIPDV